MNWIESRCNILFISIHWNLKQFEGLPGVDHLPLCFSVSARCCTPCPSGQIQLAPQRWWSTNGMWQTGKGKKPTVASIYIYVYTVYTVFNILPHVRLTVSFSGSCLSTSSEPETEKDVGWLFLMTCFIVGWIPSEASQHPSLPQVRTNYVTCSPEFQ